MLEFIISLIVTIVIRIIWGIVVDSIITNKHYEENWFWWGFFFGIIALIVALAKPDNKNYEMSNPYLTRIADEINNRNLLNNTNWKCVCGKINPNHTGTCSCGQSKRLLKELEKKKEEEKKLAIKLNDENLKLDNLKKLKELLDMGAITQEEYDNKKNEYL